VTVMDGRSPTKSDYDYKSENLGSDFIRITSTDGILQTSSGWNPKVGVVVVVGVFARTENLSYTLSLWGPQNTSVPASLNKTDLTTSFE